MEVNLIDTIVEIIKNVSNVLLALCLVVILGVIVLTKYENF